MIFRPPPIDDRLDINPTIVRQVRIDSIRRAFREGRLGRWLIAAWIATWLGLQLSVFGGMWSWIPLPAVLGPLRLLAPFTPVFVLLGVMAWMVRPGGPRALTPRFYAELRRYHYDMCGQCGYPLSDIEGAVARCPECGTDNEREPDALEPTSVLDFMARRNASMASTGPTAPSASAS